MEQSNLYDKAAGKTHATVQGQLLYQWSIPTYHCPSDHTIAANGRCKTGHDSATDWAASSYAANYLAFGNPAAGTLEQREQGRTDMAGLRDGSSNVVLFCERYGTCGTGGNLNGATVNGNLWADSNCRWRPVICVNEPEQTPNTAGYTTCLLFQISPDWLTQYETRRGQSPHQTMHVVLGDGSVQSFRSSMDAQVWSRLCDPRDGEVVTF